MGEYKVTQWELVAQSSWLAWSRRGKSWVKVTKGGGTSDVMWGWKRQVSFQDVAVFPVAASEINVIQEDVRCHQTSVCSAAHPHSRKIFSLEQVQRKATGWSEGQRVSLGQEYVYLSVTEVTAERYSSWFENRWGTIFYLHYFALNFMLVQLPKVIKTRCDVPAGWIL